MAMRHLIVVLVALAAVQDGEAGGDPACRDKNKNCEWWKGRGECANSRQWMIQNCPKSCGVCSGSGSCGQSTVTQNRVINGQDAKPGAWPWIVSLQTRGRHVCGGSLINNKWVLTAAHCKINNGFVVVAGEHNRNVHDGNEQRVKIRRVINHPNYQGRYYQYDMTLIELATPVRFNSRVQPVCLPSSGQNAGISNKCYLAGWGRTQHNRPTSMTLQQIKHPVHSKGSRKCWYRGQMDMICAGNGPHAGGGQGDSGGPLVCQQSNGRWTQVGVASFVWPKYSHVRNTLFARVSSFRGWIESKMRS